MKKHARIKNLDAFLEKYLEPIPSVKLITPGAIKVGKGKGETLKDASAHEAACIHTKLASVPEDKLSQTSELSNCIIREGSSLVSFFTHNSYSNVRLRDHVDVVCPISYRQSSLAFVPITDELDYLCLLFRRSSEYHN